MIKKIIVFVFIISFFSNVYAEVRGADMSINDDYNTKRKLTYTFGASVYGLTEAYLVFNEVKIVDHEVKFVDDPNTLEGEGSNFRVYYLKLPYGGEREYKTITKTLDPYNPDDFPKLQKDTNYRITMCVEKGDAGFNECSDRFFWINVTDKRAYNSICNGITNLDKAEGILNCYAAGCVLDNKSDGSRKCVSDEEPVTTAPYIAPAPTTCEAIFGSFYDDLQMGFKAFKIVAPLLVLIFSVSEYLKAVFSKDAEGLKDANKRLIRRGILLVVLFFLPTILNILLSLLLGTEFGTCIS